MPLPGQIASPFEYNSTGRHDTGPYYAPGPLGPISTPPIGYSGPDLRSSVYGKTIPLSQGVRSITGFPIWCGLFTMSDGQTKVSPQALNDVNFVLPANLVSAWAGVTFPFAIALGRQLAPEAERKTLSVQRIYANGVKIYSSTPGYATGTLLATANFANAETVIIGGGRLWTTNGNAQLDNGIAPKFGTAAMLCDGTGDFIDIVDSDDFTIGDQDFCVEAWLNRGGGDGTRRMVCGQGAATFPDIDSVFSLELDATNIYSCNLYTGTNPAVILKGTTAFTAAGWNHVALSRQNGFVRLFVNGILEASVAFTSTFNNSTKKFAIGKRGEDATAQSWFGSIDEFRLSVGDARYTSNFTPATAPFKYDKYTKILHHFDGGDATTFFIENEVKTYTYQTTLTNVDGNVKIGASLAASLTNLANAINLDGTFGIPGTDFAFAMTQHTSAIASADATHLFVTSKTASLGANSFQLSETAANAAWGSGNFAGGSSLDTVTQTGAFTFTLYQGSSTQTIDPTIAADRGNLSPAYRDMVYIVFTNFGAGAILGSDPYQIPTITVELKENSASLGNDLRYLALQAGYLASDIQVDAALIETVIGVNISDRYDATTLFNDLGLAYGFRHYESEDKIKFVKVPVVPFSVLGIDDVVTQNDEWSLSTTIASPSDSPFSLQVNYLNNLTYTWEQMQFLTDDNLLTHQSSADQQLKIPFVLIINNANQKASQAWYAHYAMTVQYEFLLPRKFLKLEPSDVVNITLGGYSYKIQITELTINADLSLSCIGANVDFDNAVTAATLSDFQPGVPIPAGVIPGSQTFDGATSGNFTTPFYNTLTIELWGSAGPGAGCVSSPATVVNGTAASADASVTMTGITMTCVKAGVNSINAGTAAGGNNTNTAGTNGGAGPGSWNTTPGTNVVTSGQGSGAPNGGGNAAGVNVTQNLVTQNVNGVIGTVPGGGGSGAACNVNAGGQSQGVASPGGASGGYSKSVFTYGVTVNAPTVGQLLAYALGGASTGGVGANGTGGNGRASRVKFSWA